MALIRGIAGILIFLILLGIANLLTAYVSNPIFYSVVNFLNQNILFIVLISIVLLFGELFSVLIFPFNVFYPLFNAVGGALWVVFIFRLFEFIDSMTDAGLIELFGQFYGPAIVLVFVIVIIVGYVHVFLGLGTERRVAKKRVRDDLEWKDVGEKFKGAAYNLASSLKDSLEPKKRVKKRVRKNG